MAGPALLPLAQDLGPPPATPARPALAPGGGRDTAIETLARTLWGEARTEPVRGIEAVASVVLNRVAVAAERGGWWWGDGILAVCRKPHQFRCWNPGGADYPRLLTLRAGEPVFDTCLRVARRAVAGVLADATGGATHYHALTAHPLWAAGELPTAEIGSLLFYRILE
ncbi:MAG: cell wall hydrolase [Rhodospirillaceae bacterium]